MTKTWLKQNKAFSYANNINILGLNTIIGVQNFRKLFIEITKKSEAIFL
jgi:hypothetical protein